MLYRNKSLVFDPVNHSYAIGKTNLVSVTKITSQFKSEFDSEKISKRVAERENKTQKEILREWQKKSEKALAKGECVHAYAKTVLDGIVDPIVEKANSLPELKAFRKAWKKLQKLFYARVVESEFMIGDKEWRIGGTVDCIVKMRLRDEWVYSVFDWKTGEKFASHNPFQNLKPPFENESDCQWNVYSIQTSLYRMILQKQNPDNRFMSSYIVHLMGDGNYHLYRGKDYRPKLTKWLEQRNG